MQRFNHRVFFTFAPENIVFQHRSLREISFPRTDHSWNFANSTISSGSPKSFHLARAASRVHIAQPALSTQIQSLERELGVQLLVGTTRRVELIRAGATFYERCVRILSGIDLSTEITRSVAGKTVTRIRIGTVYPETVGVLPACLARVARKYPEIREYSEDARDAYQRLLGSLTYSDLGAISRSLQ